MSVYLLVPEEDKSEVYRQLKMVGGDKQREEEITVLSKIDGNFRPKKSDIFVVNKEYGSQLIPYEESIKDRVFIWMAGTMIKYGDFSKIEREKKKALKERSWKKLRAMNDLGSSFDYIEKNVVLHSYPSCMQIETTSYCNAQCIMCPHGYLKNHDAKHLEKKILDKLDFLFPYCESIVLHGNGEPLMHPQIKELFEQYHNYGIQLLMNTNMSLVPEILLDKADEYFEAINVSCDGSNPYLYENIRKGLSFNRFIENVKLFRKSNPNVKMIMSAVAMRQNIADAVGMVYFANELGFDEVHFGVLGTSKILNNQFDELSHYPNITQVYLEKAKRVGEQLGIKVIIPEQYIGQSEPDERIINLERERMHRVPFFIKDKNMKLFAQNDIQKKDKTSEKLKVIARRECISCRWPFRNVRIDVNGNIGICCRTNDTVVGNVLEYNNFFDIWNGAVYQKVRKSFYNGERLELCRKCEYIDGVNV